MQSIVAKISLVKILSDLLSIDTTIVTSMIDYGCVALSTYFRSFIAILRLWLAWFENNSMTVGQ